MCSVCLGTGTVLAKDKTSEIPTIPYAFRCDCTTGRGKGATGIPLWGPRYERRYEPIRGVAMERPKDPEAPAQAPVKVAEEPSLSAAEDALPW